MLVDETDKFDALSDEISLRDAALKFLINDDPTPSQHHLVGALLNQMSAEQGVKKHGSRAKEVLFTEFLQLCDVDALMAVYKKDLTNE